jgi:hypothetical protein
MLSFYRPKRALLPALAAPQDLLMLAQIEALVPMDPKTARQQMRLVRDFHNTNYLSTIGAFVIFAMALFVLWIGFEDIVSLSEDTVSISVMLACYAAGIPLCYYVRIFGMGSIRRKFQKLSRRGNGA